MEYKTIFKCRLCGECYEGGCTGSENIAFSAAISVCLGVPSKDPQAPCMTEVHSCKDGSIGVADFQRFQKVEKK